MATRIQNKNGRHSTDKKPPIKTSNIPKDPGDLEEEEDPSSSAEEEDEEDEDEDGGEDEQENDALDKEIPFSDIESNDGQGEDVDIIPYTKLHKDNHAALTQALSTFALPLSTLPFHIHQSVTASEPVTIDVNDDLTRELAFYKQALEAAKEGRKRLLAEGVPFSRPADYFAEMVKDDEHMERIREKIIQEEASKKASEAAKRQRDLKKFGKQVQVTKLQDRQKEKTATLDKIKALKRKRQDGNTLTTEDDFDVELDAAAENRGRQKRTREKRNERYGFGGSKRKMKRDDQDVGDMSSFDRRGRGGFRGRGRGGMKSRGRPQRPGKQRRMQKR